jgi:UDP-N-acetylmuramate dehydrogenase
MNASAAGRGLDGVLAGVRALMLSDLKWRTLQHQELQVGYRTSLFHTRPGVISSARFILNPGNRTEILEAMNSIQIQRHRRQPTDLPNAGSVFMRPPGCYVGAIIEELGLKGFAIGDAMVSTKHGGFIVNKGRATGQQILALVGYIQERVQATHGIKLELEQRVI